MSVSGVPCNVIWVSVFLLGEYVSIVRMLHGMPLGLRACLIYFKRGHVIMNVLYIFGWWYQMDWPATSSPVGWMVSAVACWSRRWKMTCALGIFAISLFCYLLRCLGDWGPSESNWLEADWRCPAVRVSDLGVGITLASPEPGRSLDALGTVCFGPGVGVTLALPRLAAMGSCQYASTTRLWTRGFVVGGRRW